MRCPCFTQATQNYYLQTVCAEGYGDLAIEEGRYTVSVGSQEVDRGKYIVTWKKDNGNCTRISGTQIYPYPQSEPQLEPAISPDGYGMATFLTAKYGKEKSDEYMKMFQDCLVDGQEWVITTQTKW